MSDNQLLLESAPINEMQNVEPQEKLSFWQLIGITIDFCGIFFAYSLQGVVIVPLFLSFGLTQAETSLVMLISPIAVIVVFPLIGVLSDNCTLKIGKRRPFIFLGLLLQVTGLTLLAVAPDIGYLLGDSLPPAYYYGETIPVQIYAIIIGLIGYSFVDFAAGVMQLPSRALLMDVTPIEQQTIGAALFAFWMSAGNAIGYLCGSVNWSQYSIFNTIFSSQACTGSCTNYRTLFVLAALLDFITVSITLFSIKEKQLKKENSDKKGFRKFFSELVQVFKGLWDYVANRMDARTTRVLLVYFVSWLSWPLWTFYISDWVGTEVYGGDPNAPEGNPSRTDYDDGVEMASFSLFLYSVVAFIYSIILPFIIKIKWLGYRSTWAGAMFFHAVIYFALIVIRNKIATGILISLAGVNLATMHVVPWALVGFATAPADNGAAFALVNVCNALPSLLLNGLINPGLEYLFSSLVPAMCFGGATMFIAALLVFFVKKPIVEKIE